MRTYIQSANGIHIAVDTQCTFDHGWETMAFKCDSNGVITDWGGIYLNRYIDAE
jgi:hypothetical protein